MGNGVAGTPLPPLPIPPPPLVLPLPAPPLVLPLPALPAPPLVLPPPPAGAPRHASRSSAGIGHPLEMCRTPTPP